MYLVRLHRLLVGDGSSLIEKMFLGPGPSCVCVGMSLKTQYLGISRLQE